MDLPAVLSGQGSLHSRRAYPIYARPRIAAVRPRYARSPACTACQAILSPGARFCHRCGAAAEPAAPAAGRERTAWIVAAASVAVALLLMVWKVGGAKPTVPDMGNAGNIDAVPAADDTSPTLATDRGAVE